MGIHKLITQHSDSRVLEQLIYKWIHFKGLLNNVISDQYLSLHETGYQMSAKDICRDINKILYTNPSRYFNLFANGGPK